MHKRVGKNNKRPKHTKTMKWGPKGLLTSKIQRPQQWWGATLLVAPCYATQMGEKVPKMQNTKKIPNLLNLKKF